MKKSKTFLSNTSKAAAIVPPSFIHLINRRITTVATCRATRDTMFPLPYNAYLTKRIIKFKFNVIKEFLFLRPITERPLISYLPTVRNINLHKHLLPTVNHFRPSLWAPGPFGQSLFALLNKRPKYNYDRRDIVPLPDHVPVYLDWKEPPHAAHDAPIIVICHGIAGDSTCSFPIKLSDAAYEQNWRTVVYNRRGHNTAPLTNTKSTHKPKGYPTHADTDDMHHVCLYIQKQFPNAPLILAGTSAGANLSLRYLHDYANEHPFKLSVASASCYNVHRLIQHFKHKNPLGHSLLAMCLIDNMRNRLPCLPKLAECHNIPFNHSQIERLKNVWELDEHLTLPYYKNQYATIDDYYKHISSHKSLNHINIPTLLLNSRDDPLIYPALTHYAEEAAFHNQNIISVITNQGGHAGWLTGLNLKSWEIDIITKFINGGLDN